MRVLPIRWRCESSAEAAPGGAGGVCGVVVGIDKHGPFYNDYRIAQHPGRALAHVTAVGAKRTAVEYQDGEGIFHSPAAGVFYPTGLGEGQRVWVTYSTEDPDLVKVENRSWTLAIVPALSVAAVSTVVAVVLWWLVGFFSRRAVRRHRA